MDGSFWSTVDNNCSEFVDDAGTSSAFSLTAAPDLATWTSPGSAGRTVSSPLVATVGLIVCGHGIYSISSSSSVIGRPSSVVVVVVVVVVGRRRRRRRRSSVCEIHSSTQSNPFFYSIRLLLINHHPAVQVVTLTRVTTELSRLVATCGTVQFSSCAVNRPLSGGLVAIDDDDCPTSFVVVHWLLGC